MHSLECNIVAEGFDDVDEKATSIPLESTTATHKSNNDYAFRLMMTR